MPSRIGKANKVLNKNNPRHDALNRNVVLFAAVISAFLSSWATRLTCDSGAPRLSILALQLGHGENTEERLTGFLRNTERQEFTITRVRSIRPLPTCGMDLLATVFTLGLIPHAAPQPMEATVEGSFRGQMITRMYWLGLQRNTSVWHLLIPASSDELAIGRAILQSIDLDRQVPRAFGMKPKSKDQ